MATTARAAFARKPKPLVLLCALFAFMPLSAALGQDFDEFSSRHAMAGQINWGLPDFIVIETRPTNKPGFASLLVKAEPDEARIYLNYRLVGKSGYGNKALVPGSYLVEISAPRHYGERIFMVLADQTEYILSVKLRPIMGYLELSSTPSDAQLFVDGNAIKAGRQLLQIGSYTVRARRFGYIDAVANVTIEERRTSSLSLVLKPAPFSVSELKASRSSFNPKNAGMLGRSRIRFSVTSFGSAVLRVFNAEGEQLRAWDFPSFSTWDQSLLWDGKDGSGRPLPDGAYKLRLEARSFQQGLKPRAENPGAPGNVDATSSASAADNGGADASAENQATSETAAALPQGPDTKAEPGTILRDLWLRIDSSILIRAISPLSAMQGSAFFPDPSPGPAGTTAIDFAWLFPQDGLRDSCLALGFAVAPGRGTNLGFSAAVELGEDPGADLALSFLARIWRSHPLFTIAAFARGSWSSKNAVLMPGASSSLEAGLPMALGFGDLRIGLCPGIALVFPSGEPRWEFALRAGLWYQWSWIRAALSAECFFDLAEGFSPRWPMRCALETRGLIPGTPLSAGFLVLADFVDTGSPLFGFGLSMGFLF